MCFLALYLAMRFVQVAAPIRAADWLPREELPGIVAGGDEIANLKMTWLLGPRIRQTVLCVVREHALHACARRNRLMDIFDGQYVPPVVPPNVNKWLTVFALMVLRGAGLSLGASFRVLLLVVPTAVGWLWLRYGAARLPRRLWLLYGLAIVSTWMWNVAKLGYFLASGFFVLYVTCLERLLRSGLNDRGAQWRLVWAAMASQLCWQGSNYYAVASAASILLLARAPLTRRLRAAGTCAIPIALCSILAQRTDRLVGADYLGTSRHGFFLNVVPWAHYVPVLKAAALDAFGWIPLFDDAGLPTWICALGAIVLSGTCGALLVSAIRSARTRHLRILLGVPSLHFVILMSVLFYLTVTRSFGLASAAEVNMIMQARSYAMHLLPALGVSVLLAVRRATRTAVVPPQLVWSAAVAAVLGCLILNVVRAVRDASELLAGEPDAYRIANTVRQLAATQSEALALVVDNQELPYILDGSPGMPIASVGADPSLAFTYASKRRCRLYLVKRSSAPLGRTARELEVEKDKQDAFIHALGLSAIVEDEATSTSVFAADVAPEDLILATSTGGLVR